MVIKAKSKSVSGSGGGSGGGLLRPLLILSSLIVPVFFALAIRYHQCIFDKLFPLPDLRTFFPFEDEEWTLTKSSPTAKQDIVPWKLQVSNADLEDLKERLRRTRYGTPMPNQNFAYGFPADQLKKVSVPNCFLIN